MGERGRTSNNDGQQRESAIALDERVQHDAGAGANGHGDEQRRPALR